MKKNPFHALDTTSIMEIARVALSDRGMQNAIGEELDLDDEYLNDLQQALTDAMELEQSGTMTPEEFVTLVNKRSDWTDLTMPLERSWFDEEDAPDFIVRKVGEFLYDQDLHSLAERLTELAVLVKDGNDAALVVGQMVNAELN